MLQLDIGRLKRSQGESSRFELAVELPSLELQGESISFAGPANAVLTVLNTGKNLVVEGIVSGTIELTCSRCLKHFIFDFEAPIEETYVHSMDNYAEQAIPYSGDMLDLTPEVLKSILLELPMKAVCSEECRGLCPKCGSDLNKDGCGCVHGDVDPRLSVLKNLLEEKY